MAIKISNVTAIDDNRNLTDLKVLGVFETKVDLAAGTGTFNIDLKAGSFFTKTVSGSTTFNVSNIPASGLTGSFILELTNAGSYVIAWGTGFNSIKWASGLSPSFTTAGTDLLAFYTTDGGANWRGILISKDVK